MNQKLQTLPRQGRLAWRMLLQIAVAIVLYWALTGAAVHDMTTL
ncbi:MAG: hypothetical protein U1F36_17875 [Planctomycetota bacterium]